MKQYLDLLKEIKNKGTWKNPAREGMPRTLSLFGHQMRFNLQEGFPILTTKEVSFKNIVVELLWFLKSDTNIKYLVDNGCNIWNEDAYNYYLKQMKIQLQEDKYILDYKSFVSKIKEGDLSFITLRLDGYKLGDCGKQYGWLWRNWEDVWKERDNYTHIERIDQIKILIEGLKSNPESRRHIISAWNPATLDQMALNACHPFVQFNCREISRIDRQDYFGEVVEYMSSKELDDKNVPKYYLDCKFTMRSNDVFLGNPYNVASYALLTHILCKICNMIPGDLVADLGDVHIYENHMDQVNIQLERTPKKLPKLNICDNWVEMVETHPEITLDSILDQTEIDDFSLEDYNPQPAIRAKLSTGLK